MSSREPTSLTVVPDPVEVQKHLAQVLREGRLLRQQLRLSVRAEEEQRRRQEGAHATSST